jgi:hypothetical protein|tara:strand:+ start:487 stop:660 length:174 start_codon:yes stop_codon:yes gene_type:complete
MRDLGLSRAIDYCDNKFAPLRKSVSNHKFLAAAFIPHYDKWLSSLNPWLQLSHGSLG